MRHSSSPDTAEPKRLEAVFATLEDMDVSHCDQFSDIGNQTLGPKDLEKIIIDQWSARVQEQQQQQLQQRREEERKNEDDDDDIDLDNLDVLPSDYALMNAVLREEDAREQEEILRKQIPGFIDVEVEGEDDNDEMEIDHEGEEEEEEEEVIDVRMSQEQGEEERKREKEGNGGQFPHSAKEYDDDDDNDSQMEELLLSPEIMQTPSETVESSLQLHQQVRWSQSLIQSSLDQKAVLQLREEVSQEEQQQQQQTKESDTDDTREDISNDDADAATGIAMLCSSVVMVSSGASLDESVPESPPTTNGQHGDFNMNDNNIRKLIITQNRADDLNSLNSDKLLRELSETASAQSLDGDALEHFQEFQNFWNTSDDRLRSLDPVKRRQKHLPKQESSMSHGYEPHMIHIPSPGSSSEDETLSSENCMRELINEMSERARRRDKGKGPLRQRMKRTSRAMDGDGEEIREFDEEVRRDEDSRIPVKKRKLRPQAVKKSALVFIDTDLAGSATATRSRKQPQESIRRILHKKSVNKKELPQHEPRILAQEIRSRAQKHKEAELEKENPALRSEAFQSATLSAVRVTHLNPYRGYDRVDWFALAKAFYPCTNE